MRHNSKIYNLLFEEEAKMKDAPERNISFKADATGKARKSADSVDDQIDSLLLMYEQKAIREKDELMENLRNLSLKMLFEQDEEGFEEDEPAEDAPDDAAAEEEEVVEPEGSEKMTATEPATSEQIPDIDIDKFTIKVARLVMNYKNLLRVEDVIINRAKNFLDDNYGDKFVSKYLEILNEQFGLEPQEFPNVDYPDPDVYAADNLPSAAGAGTAAAE